MNVLVTMYANPDVVEKIGLILAAWQQVVPELKCQTCDLGTEVLPPTMPSGIVEVGDQAVGATIEACARRQWNVPTLKIPVPKEFWGSKKKKAVVWQQLQDFAESLKTTQILLPSAETLNKIATLELLQQVTDLLTKPDSPGILRLVLPGSNVDGEALYVYTGTVPGTHRFEITATQMLFVTAASLAIRPIKISLEVPPQPDDQVPSSCAK